MSKRAIILLFMAIAAVGLVWLRPIHKENRPRVVPHEQAAKESEQPRDIANEVAGAMPLLPPPTVAGNYLAARFAIANDNLEAANTFYTRAINNVNKPETRAFLIERSLPTAIGAGDMQSAVDIAGKIDLKQPTATAQLAVLLKVINGFKQHDPKKVDEFLPLLRSDGFGRLLKPLLESWNLVAKKENTAAKENLEKLQKEFPSLKPLVQMHLAFIHDYENDKTLAELYYSRALQDHASIRMAYIAGQFYERHDNKAAALKLYKTVDAQMPNVPWPKLAVARLEKNIWKDKAFISGPGDGAAAALYDVATVLHQENSSRLAVLYAQMAHYLMPQDEFASLLLGDILATTNAGDEGEKFFAANPESSDLYALSQMRLAQLYEQEGDYNKAVETLENFEHNPVLSRQAAMELGDLYRRREDFAKAIPYYTKVLEQTPNLAEKDWVLLYSRGICYERNGEWEKAEADLKQALKLSPQQPEVLNYLAYSWADHGQNLDIALEMLQKALAGAPDDPYISDSVGWALYKNGQYEQAVPFLEISVQQLPEDPVINDHLGDIYWSVGRRLEAGFQWERALKNVEKSLAKDQKESDKELRSKLQAKLRDGLIVDAKPSSSKTAKAE